MDEQEYPKVIYRGDVGNSEHVTVGSAAEEKDQVKRWKTLAAQAEAADQAKVEQDKKDFEARVQAEVASRLAGAQIHYPKQIEVNGQMVTVENPDDEADKRKKAK